MRFLLLIAATALFYGSFELRAEDRKFPYTAFVDADEGEYVRSGPGPKFYPTDKLRKGDRIQVHRHDPGGWCMIAPPQGSFSWIRAEHVQKSGPQSGVLKANGVVVHVGSHLNPDEFTTVQGNLSKGDAVEILGEKMFQFDDEPRLMYKISPVRREWRWIARKSIQPADAVRSEPLPAEPAPRKKTGPVAERDDDAFARPISTGPVRRDDDRLTAPGSKRSGSEDSAVRQTGPTAEQIASGRRRLDEIDDEFRAMIRQEPLEWDLDSLERQYKNLDEEFGVASMTSTIGLRLDAVKRYRDIYKNYLDFSRLSAETKQRDAALSALQTPDAVRSTVPPAVVTPVPSTGPPVSNSPPINSRPAVPPTNGPAFDGAGIVQKMAKTFAGGPQFVLIAPDGRMLAYLEPGPGVDLNRYLGKSMGITGQRIHRDDWNADLITVRNLQPVQLKTR